MRTGRPRTAEASESITLRIASADVDRLRAIAADDDVTIAHLIRKSVRHFLEKDRSYRESAEAGELFGVAITVPRLPEAIGKAGDEQPQTK